MLNWDFSPYVILAVVIQAVLLIVNLTRTNDKARAAAEAIDALKATAAAKRDLEDVKLNLAALNAAFNIFQVGIAKEYISRDLLREFEARITEASKENADRLERRISELREVVMKTIRDGSHG